MENQPRPNGRSMRGFASMDKVKQKEIASKGGRAAHEKGTAHEFSSEEASLAAKRGHERGTAHEFTTDEARIAGRKGGMARAANRRNQGTDVEISESSMSNPNPPEAAASGNGDMHPAPESHNPS